MSQHISLQCYCGLLKGHITNARPPFAVRYVCMCDDCQSYAHYLGHAERVLDGNGGTELYPVPQSYIKITVGKEHLQCLRLTETGIYRWFAGCCNTPIANSASARMPFVGVVHSIMRPEFHHTTREELMGPIHDRVMAKFGIPPFPPGTSEGITWNAVWRTTLLALVSFIKREAWPSPFYNKNSKPIVRPYILAKAENETIHNMISQPL